LTEAQAALDEILLKVSEIRLKSHKFRRISAPKL
jgi:hypothetical protein